VSNNILIISFGSKKYEIFVKHFINNLSVKLKNMKREKRIFSQNS